jgi:hypothetical protein
MAPPRNGGIMLDFDRLLTLQDFEIIPNPAYKELI